MDTELIGQRLKAERIRQGLSMREVERKAKLGLGTMQRIEAGKSYDFNYGKVAAVLGLDLEQEQSA